MAEKCEVIWFVLRLLTLVVFLVGFGADYWLQADDLHIGLWRACKDGQCIYIGSEVSATLKSVRALMCWGLIILVLAAITHLIYLIQTSLADRMEMTARISSIIGGIFGVLGCIVFWANEPKANGFALIISFVSSVWMIGYGVYRTLAPRLPPLFSRYEGI